MARAGRATRLEVEVTEVTFRVLTAVDIEAYVASREAQAKAGSYAIQGRGAGLVASIRGCYYNVVGLPLRRTAAILELSPFQCDCGRQPLQTGGEGCGGRLSAFSD